MTNNALKHIVRLGFLGWWLFEFLNWLKVLHFSLDFSWSGLLITVSFIWLAIEVVNWRMKKSGMQSLPWFVYLIGLAGVSWDALGDVAHFYTRIMYYDKYAHFLGGASAGVVFLFLFWRMLQVGKINLNAKLLGLLAIGAGNLLGMLYELEEYSESLFVHNNRMGDAFDTTTDVLFNMCGAIVFVSIFIYFLNRNKQLPVTPKNDTILQKNRSPLITVMRLGFLGWICFELLNLAHLLHFEFNYSWIGLLVTVSFVWIGIEVISARLQKSGLQPLPWLIYLIGFLGVSWNAISGLMHVANDIIWLVRLDRGLSGMAIGIIFFYIFWQIQIAKKINLGPRMLGFLSLGCTMLVCALYTFSKFFETKLFHNGRLPGGQIGGFATDNGFLWNIIGAAVIIIAAVMLVKKSTAYIQSRSAI